MPDSIGKWVRGFGYKYWEGPCICGSGEPGQEAYDKMGIYCGVHCKQCMPDWAPGIMPGDPEPYDVDEPIDED